MICPKCNEELIEIVKEKIYICRNGCKMIKEAVKTRKGYYDLRKGFRLYELHHENKNIIATNDVKSFDKYLEKIGLGHYKNQKRKLRTGIEVL